MLYLPELIEVSGVSSSELEFLVLPKLKSVNFNGFNNCPKLKMLNFPELNYVRYGGFDGCTNLKILILPKLEISHGFQNCPNIRWNNMNEASNAELKMKCTENS